MYGAKVIKVTTIEPMEKADRLLLLKYNGLQFVVGSETKVGDLVILFPYDGKLSPEFCRHNNLYKDSSLNDDTTKTGYFSDNCRVISQRFRGEKSEGFVCSPEAFAYLGKVNLEEDMEFTSLNGKIVCEKFYTKATLEKIRNLQKSSGKKFRWTEYELKEHFDTQHLAYNIERIKNQGIYYWTEKVHGTSARTGNVKISQRTQNFFQKILSSILHTNKYSEKEFYDYVTGTRHTVVNDRRDITEPGGNDHYRWEWHNFFKGKLKNGESVFYEIVGYDSNGGTIMEKQNLQKLKDKALSKVFPEQMVYSYGTKNIPGMRTDIYVYRITQEAVSGEIIELSWQQVQQRCKELNVKPVPELLVLIFVIENEEVIRDVVKEMTEAFLNNGASTIDKDHMMEGICLRIESNAGTAVFKQKNFAFGVLEGYLKESSDYIDTEEIN